jgi:hypothetical protein
MIRSAMLAVAIVLPLAAAAQQDPGQTDSIPQKPGLTEQQVRDRLKTAGYTAIGSLDLDAEGFWRTTAMKGADMMSISVNRDGSIEDR